MIRTALIAALTLSALPAWADEKTDVCERQSQVVGAIQQARLDRVPQAKVIPNLMEANPNLPGQLESALPALVGWMYDQRMRDLRNTDLAATSKQQCLDNWDAIQSQNIGG
ncbi:MAG: hypothetical protein AAF218_00470 [Pseudomonadota bacterium]